MGSAKFIDKELHVRVTPFEISGIAILMRENHLMNLGSFVSSAAMALMKKKQPEKFKDFAYDEIKVRFENGEYVLVYSTFEPDAIIGEP
jgi:hypothetical protein